MDRFLGTTVHKCGHILEDLAVEQAARSQHPVVLSSPDSAAAHCITRVAQDLVPGSAALRREGPGLFERLASLVEAHAEI